VVEQEHTHCSVVEQETEGCGGGVHLGRGGTGGQGWRMAEGGSRRPARWGGESGVGERELGERDLRVLQFRFRESQVQLLLPVSTIYSRI
jgi:hypothetical protein